MKIVPSTRLSAWRLVSRRLWPWTVLACAVLLSGCGATILRTPCESPRISNRYAPSSYLVVLPYRYRGDIAAHGDALAGLNQLATLELLRGAARLEGTHMTLVEGDPADPRCGIEAVYGAVAENRSAPFWRWMYRSAVFFWGQAYEDDGGGLRVRTHLRMRWNGSEDREIQVRIAHPALPEPLVFGGDLPLDTISLPTRRISIETLERLQGGPALRMRPDRDLSSPSQPVPRRFVALTWKRPWLHVQDMGGEGGVTGWIHIDDALVDATPRPESLFTQLLTTYLNARASGTRADGGDALDLARRFRAAVQDSVRRGLADEDSFDSALAVTSVVEGTLGLSQLSSEALEGGAASDPVDALVQTVAREQAPVQFEQALRRIPGSADIANLTAIAQIAACCSGSPQPSQLRRVQQLLEQARDLQPGNLKIVGNLANWYRYLAVLPPDLLPFDAHELPARTRETAQSLRAWTQLSGH